MATKVPPAIIVIFGITGDLAQRKLMPALYNLFKADLLDERTVVLGITRRNVTAEDVLDKLKQKLADTDEADDPTAIKKVESALRMHTMDQTEPAEYRKLLDILNGIEEEIGVCMDRLYYLSIPPQLFNPIVRNLGEQGLNGSCQHGKASTRLLVEKPFGYDLKSARELIEETGKYFKEDQLFRIDHYLAKDTVQNLIAFRRENPKVESIWNDQYIQCVTITAFEKIDIEGRATFYEEVGALRDFIQSHLLQLLAVTTMNLPENMDSDSMHRARLDILKSIQPISKMNVPTSAVRGQYEGYRTEVSNPNSNTETFAAVRLISSNPAWESVSMTLQTGKAMAEKRTDVVITFNGGSELTYHIQPKTTGVTLEGEHKPAFILDIEPCIKQFNEEHPVDVATHPDEYERVLLDAILGDHTLFTTSEEVLAAWKIVDAVVEVWARSSDGLKFYPKGATSVS